MPRCRNEVSRRLDALADWWDKFATTEVGSVESFSGRETRESADHVAAALRAWHEAGTAAGDLAFWRERAEQFRSPKAYALVVDALLEQRIPVAAMALLVQWLEPGRGDPAGRGGLFVPRPGAWTGWRISGTIRRARSRLCRTRRRSAGPCRGSSSTTSKPTPRSIGEVPQFRAGRRRTGRAAARSTDEIDDMFGAAYEDVTYRDSTDDGFEGEMFEGGGDQRGHRLRAGRRGRADRRPADLPGHPGPAVEAGRRGLASAATCPPADREQVLAGWLDQACNNRQQLLELLAAVHRYRIPPPRGTQESLVEYDRRRSVKEMLLEQIIATCVETGDAARMIRVVMDHRGRREGQDGLGRAGRRGAAGACSAATRRACARSGRS